MTLYPRVSPRTPVPPCTESLRARTPPPARTRVGGGYTRVRGYKPPPPLTAQGGPGDGTEAAPMTAAETCSRCGAPLVWADGRLVCPRAPCRGHQPHPAPDRQEDTRGPR